MELFCEKKNAKRLSNIFERVLSTLLRCAFSSMSLKPLSANPTKWSNTQTICRLLPTNCLSVFDDLVGLTLARFNVGLDFRINPDFLGKRIVRLFPVSSQSIRACIWIKKEIKFSQKKRRVTDERQDADFQSFSES